MSPEVRSDQRRRGGFSLIESLVALALVALALLMGLAILLRQPRAQVRLHAGGEALRTVEAAIETLRATPSLPLDDRRLAPGIEYPENPDIEGLQVWLAASAASRTNSPPPGDIWPRRRRSGSPPRSASATMSSASRW